MLCFSHMLLNLLIVLMSVYLVKIRENRCNHLKRNLFLGEILLYAVSIHIFILFNHIPKIQKPIFASALLITFPNQENPFADELLMTFFSSKKNLIANVFV